MTKYILAIAIILAAALASSAQTLKLPALARPVTETYPARTVDDFRDDHVVEVTRMHRLRQSSTAQTVMGIVNKPGRQHGDWLTNDKPITWLPGKPRLGQVIHAFAFAVGTGGLFGDGFSSRKYNRVVIKNLTTGAVTVIEEGNPLFTGIGGTFKSRKYTFGYAIPIMLGSEFARQWCAACADMTEVFLGSYGLYNTYSYVKLTRFDYVIVGKLPAPTGK